MPSYSEMLLGERESAQTTPSQAPPQQAVAPARPNYSDMLLGTIEQADPELTPQSSFEHSARAIDIAKASLADDPQARAKFYAKQRGLPVERYRIHEGRVIYQDDDGQWYQERPNAQLSDPRTWFQNLAGMPGPALSYGPAIATGVATAPMMLAGPAGMAGSIGLTATAGAGGQAAREALASQFVDQEMSPGRIAQQAAVEGLSQGIGGGLMAYGQRHAARDIARLDPRATQRLATKAQQQGIQLTPAEATNLSSLKAQQKMLGNVPQSADVMSDFYQRRATEQVAPAVERQLERMSPVGSAEIAGQMARGAAQGAMERVAGERAAAASPLYQRAFMEASEANVTPVLQRIDAQLKIAKGGIKDALTRARSLLVREEPILDPQTGRVVGRQMAPENRLEALHQAKLALDDMIEGARQSGLGRTAKRQLVGIKNDLLSLMDDASPSYRAARQIYADMTPGVERIREGVVGILADLPDTKLQTAAAKIFSPSVSIRDVSKARFLLRDQSPEAWQALKRLWLEEHWIKAGKEYATIGAPLNRGAKFRAAIFGDPHQMQLARTALEPQELRGWTDLMDVLEATGRVKPIGSDTAWNQEIMKATREQGAHWIARALRYASFDLFKEVSNRMTEAGLRRHAGRLADLVTSPDGIARMRELKQFRAPDAVKRVLLGHLIGITGEQGAASALSPAGVVEEVQ